MHRVKFNNQEEASCLDCQRNVAEMKRRWRGGDPRPGVDMVCSNNHPWLIVNGREFDANKMPEVH